MAKGLRISPMVGVFLSLTWTAFFLSYAMFSGAAASLLQASLPELCMVVAGFSAPLVLIRSMTRSLLQGAQAPGSAGQPSGLTTDQFAALSEQIDALKRVQLLPENTDNHIKAITKAFRQQTKGFEASCKGLAETLEKMNGDIDTGRSKVEALQSSLVEQSATITKTLDAQAKTLASNKESTEGLLTSLEGATAKSREATAEVIERLADPIKLVEERIAKSSSEMAALIQALETQLDETAEGFEAARLLSEDTKQAVAYQSQELAAVVTHTNKQLAHLGSSLPQQIDAIEKLGATASGKAAELEDRLTHQLNIAVDTAHAMAERSQTMQQTFAQQAQQLDQLAGMLDELSNGASKSIAKDLRSLIAESQHAAKALGQSSHSARGMMQAVFDRQNDLAAQAMHELNSRMERMIASIRDSFAGAEYDAGRLEEALATLAQRVTHSIAENGDRIVGDLEQRMGGLREQSDYLGASLMNHTHEATKAMDMRLMGFDKRRQQLDHHLNGLTENMAQQIEGQMGEVIAMIGHKMQSVGGEIDTLRQTLQQVDQVNQQAIDAAAEAWFHKLRNATDQVLGAAEQALLEFEAEVANSAYRVSHAVEQQTEVAARQSEHLADRAAERVSARLVNLFDTVEERARLTEESVARTEAGMREGINKVADDMRRLLNSFAVDMSEASDSAISKLIAQGREVPELAERMAVSAQEALSVLKQTGESYGSQRQQIRSIVNELEEMAGRIERRVAAVDEQVDRVGENLDNQTDTVRSQVDQLQSLLTSFHATGGELTRAIEERAALLAESTEQTGHVVENVETRLRSLAEVATNHLETAHKFAVDVSNEAEDDLLRLDHLSKTTFERWSETRQTMGASLNEVTAQVADLQTTLENMAAVADQQSAKLSAHSEEAQARAQHLIDALNEGQKSAFLRTASELVAKLQDAAIDVDTILQGQLPNKVIQAINSGDRSVSVRRLLGMRGDADGPIRNKYASDREFRESADTFMSGCERLLRLALDADPSRLMHTTVLTADVGKLYLYLRDALSRDSRVA